MSASVYTIYSRKPNGEYRATNVDDLEQGVAMWHELVDMWHESLPDPTDHAITLKHNATGDFLISLWKDKKNTIADCKKGGDVIVNAIYRDYRIKKKKGAN